MFQSFGNLLQKPTEVRVWEEHDLKHIVQSYIRNELKSEHVYCIGATNGVISIRVASPTMHQAVCLLEYDIQLLFKEDTNYKFKRLDVRLE